MSNDILKLIRIDHRSSIPVHQQIFYELQSLITIKKIPIGSKLPSVEAVSAHFLVKPASIKKIYYQLLSEHFLEIDDENGFQVGYYELSTDYQRPFYTIIERLDEMGLKPFIKPLEVKIITLSNQECKKTGFSNEERVLYVKRLYYAGNRPYFLGEHYFPLSIFPMFEGLKGNERFYPLMKSEANVDIFHSKRYAQALSMDKKMASLFLVKTGSTYMKLESFGFDQSKRQVEYSFIYMLGNYSLQIKTNRDQIKGI